MKNLLEQIDAASGIEIIAYCLAMGVCYLLMLVILQDSAAQAGNDDDDLI